MCFICLPSFKLDWKSREKRKNKMRWCEHTSEFVCLILLFRFQYEKCFPFKMQTTQGQQHCFAYKNWKKRKTKRHWIAENESVVFLLWIFALNRRFIRLLPCTVFTEANILFRQWEKTAEKKIQFNSQTIQKM